MRSPNELVDYLNSYFGPELWRGAGNLLGNFTVSQLAEELSALPVVDGFGNAQIDFDRPPGFTLIDDAHVRVMVPGVDQLLIEGDVVLDGLPDSHLVAGFSIDLVAGPDIPDPAAHVDINFRILDGFARWALGISNPPLFLIMLGIEGAVESIVPGFLEPRVNSKLGALGSYRFDRTHDLNWPMPNFPQIEGVWPASFHGSRDPASAGYVDLLFVADGCSVGDLAPFNELATALADRLAPSSSNAPKPFEQFRSAIRIWKMELVADPADVLQRAAVAVSTDNRTTLNFSNLARVAEIGLTARAAFAHDPIIIFASKVGDPNTRANTQGPYVLLDLPAFGPDAVDTVIHELGHSPLGHYLADEYPPGSRTSGCSFNVGNKTYHGPEPRPRNVSTNALIGLVKWQPWSVSLPGGQTGGYEHDLGVLRFKDVCRMRCSDATEFCEVCREELALGLLEHGHRRVGVPGARGRVDVLIEYIAPWTEAMPRHAHLVAGEVAHLDVLASDATGPATRVRLTVAGSSVPEGWDVNWTLRNANSVSGPSTSPSIEIDVRPGAQVDVRVRHDGAATNIFSPFHTNPQTTAGFLFDQERRISALDLLPPTQLQQSVAVGEVIVPVIDPATGRVSLPAPLWVEARNGGIQGYQLPTSVSFRLEGPGAYQEDFDSVTGPAGVVRRWTMTTTPPRGGYAWMACTKWRALKGRYVDAPQSQEHICWEIASLPFVDEPQPPMDPFNLQLLETATVPSLPAGLDAWSWHPNDRPINFLFEMKQDPQPFDGLGLSPTGFLTRDLGDTESVAINGRFFFFGLLPQPGSSGDLYHWRVKAVDDAGGESNWVVGRDFFIYLPAGRPRTLREFAEFLEDLRVYDFIDPRGPLDVPRIFVAGENDWPSSERKDLDFSKLKDIVRGRKVDG
ncbi:MAG: hypothetical protein AABN95_08685 [Acidobacteriota bacterium]